MTQLDYAPPPRPQPIGSQRAWSITTWLIAINIVVYLLDSSFGYVFPLGRVGIATYFGAFSYALAIAHLQVWRFITFQFVHAGLQHIAFNMFALYLFGPMVEAYLGRRRFLAFYLLCGIAGAVCYTGMAIFGILRESPYAPLVGASAGIFGVLIAAGTRVAPDATVMLLFPPIPMKLRTMAWGLVAIAIFVVFTSGKNAGGEAAHLGGAAVGYVLIQTARVRTIFQGSRGSPLS